MATWKYVLTAGLAIGFGNTNTTVVKRNASGLTKTVELDSLTTSLPSAEDAVYVVPSVIYYPGVNQRPLIGAEVSKVRTVDSQRRMASFKKYLNYTHGHEIDGDIVSFSDAAKDFLAGLLGACQKEKLLTKHESLTFSLPIDAFEQYAEWIGGVCKAEGFDNINFIDEPAAAVLATGKKQGDGSLLLLCDLGATTLDLSIVQFKADAKEVKRGKHCALIAHTSMETAGNAIDNWLASAAIKDKRIKCDDAEKQDLIDQCRWIKESLSFEQSVQVDFLQTSFAFSQNELAQLLKDQDFFNKLEKALDRLIDTAVHDFGFEENDVQTVVAIGGIANIPSVKDYLRTRFLTKFSETGEPTDALARGAAVFSDGEDVFSHLQHDYAVYYFDAKANDYKFDVVVKRGTAYPSLAVLSSRTVTATTFNQSKFELIICELEQESEDGRIHFNRRFINKEAPFLVYSRRPIQLGCEAFKVEFLVDEKKQLLINTYNFNRRGDVEADLVRRPIVKLR